MELLELLELQAALEEAEGTLEQEENKVLRSQVDPGEAGDREEDQGEV